MGFMGTAGTLSINFVLPIMGSIFDNKVAELAGGAGNLAAIAPDKMELIKAQAAGSSFQAVAILPALLLVVFGGIWFYDRSKGGFKAVKIS